MNEILLAYLGLKATRAYHFIDSNNVHKSSFNIAELFIVSKTHLFKPEALELVNFKGTIHELSEAILGSREHIWNLLSAHSLNQAQQAALNILVVVSEEFVNVFVKVLVDRDDHPLRIHLEQEQECQDRLAAEHDRLVLQ